MQINVKHPALIILIIEYKEAKTTRIPDDHIVNETFFIEMGNLFG
mgnify:CR=1 FL=1